MPKTESEKIDCLYRPCSRPAPRGKIESVRTHSEVIEQFDPFSLLKLLFLVRNWLVTKGFSSPNYIPKPGKKLPKRRFFDTADRHHEKLYGRSRLYASAQGRHKTGGVLSLFLSLSVDILIKNSVQRLSSDFQDLFRVKIRKMAQGSNDLSTLPLILHYLCFKIAWVSNAELSPKILSWNRFQKRPPSIIPAQLRNPYTIKSKHFFKLWVRISNFDQKCHYPGQKHRDSWESWRR